MSHSWVVRAPSVVAAVRLLRRRLAERRLAERRLPEHPVAVLPLLLEQAPARMFRRMSLALRPQQLQPNEEVLLPLVAPALLRRVLVVRGLARPLVA